MSRSPLSGADEGKRVVDSEGRDVGIVTGFREGDAYVDPDPSISETIMSQLGWDTVSEDDYRLEPEQVDTVTDDEVRLRDV